MEIDKTKWYTSKQAAEILNVHPKTLERYFTTGRLWGKKNPDGDWITSGEALLFSQETVNPK